MDRQERVKYSLLEVFGLELSGSSETRSLMESYGVSPARIAAGPARTSASDLIREAIETGTISLLETADPDPAPRGAQRDDIALQRWREMAGLDDKGGQL